ncbi:MULTISPECIES: metallophosphoesterase [Bacillaceae]|uniref:metallophosphoesterase family protein n=1 Tax=Bacillaceae TaxID=186817 RepID=UPI00273D1FB5|nr:MULTISPECIES: metallophosphoesterase [Bacillus]MDT0162806.1 metallophosphoesterase [Bacillus sp. AG4(2022)]MDW2879084.1 metallophosphoesterase [Bacillus infantis]
MKIAMIGDLHYPAINEEVLGLKEARTAFYETFMNYFLDIEADFHVSIGDLTNFGLPNELEEIYSIIRQKDRTFYHALGNHDVYAMTKKEVLAITGQKQYHSFENEKAVFAFLDTAREMNYEDWGGWMDEEQLNWFETVVAASGSKPLLVFAHHPVYNTTTRSDGEKGSIHRDIDMWKVLSQKKGLGVYFNGHTHVDSIVQQNNWTFVQKSACLDQQAVRVIEIGQEEISVSAIDLDDDFLVEKAGFIAGNIPHFGPTPAARGTQEQRECRIPLNAAAYQL